MRFLMPLAVAASILVPTAAWACPNCVMHGTEREDKAWSTIMGRQNPLMPATASTPAQPAQSVKPAKASKPGSQAKAATKVRTAN